MAGEWREATLDQLGRIVTGKTPASSGPGFFGGDVPFVTPTDFDGRRVIESTGRYLTEQGADAVSGSRIPRRAVMVSCIGSDMGKAVVAGRECVTNQQINSIVVESGDDPLFVYYNLSTRKAEIRAAAGGSAQPILNKSAFGRIEIFLPASAEQRAIAHILGTLDDKIELNRRMNEALEAMARALFKSWFVDFDPVRAKAERRDPGLPNPVANLFPDRFEDSELGEIPAGWRVSDLTQVTAQITKGTTPTETDMSNATASDARINYLRVNAIAENGSILYDKITKIPETVHKGALKRSILRANDVVYTIAGTIGRVGVVEDDLLPANTNQAVAIIRPKPGLIPPGFLVLTMRQQAFQEELHSNIVHAVQANLSLGMISRANAVFPPLDSLDKIFKPIEALLRKASANRRESRILAALRDTLLPKLISGELRLSHSIKQLWR
ncbi:MAG: restriction endonuclease subunit S [Deltaproteobacteria bacterium]|nr:restriction endonuclease subunit S [Deltaproteobacteria bacterium]